jgi:transcriptional regulator with XRE-family HTH domain
VPKSQIKTKVAYVRNAMGMSTLEFADMVGRSVHTLKSLESGRLALSQGLAELMHDFTGVSVKWLMDEHGGGRPISDNGKELTGDEMLAIAVSRRAEMKAFADEVARDTAEADVIGSLGELGVAIAQSDNPALVVYRIKKILGEAVKDAKTEKPKSAGSKKKRP